MFACLDFAPGQLPADQPRYLMGVGKPDDIVGAVERGIDMFDCVMPTRSGRTGQAFTRTGPINLRNARFGEDQGPLDPACACPVCATWTRAYIHHLVRSQEILGAMLMTEHNIWFYEALMADLRHAIATGALTAFATAFRDAYRGGPTGVSMPPVSTDDQPNEILAAVADAKAREHAAVGANDKARRMRWPMRIIGVGIGSAAVAAAVLFANSGKKSD